MRTVLSHHDVAHAWAHQTQEHARNSGGNLYFNGKTIYSYGSHFPIAKFTEDTRGETIILVTTRTYSNTTAKHQRIVENAISHLSEQIIYCKHPDGNHTDNINAFVEEIREIAPKLQKARKPEKYLQEIREVSILIESYCEAFGLEIPEYVKQVTNLKGYKDYQEWAKQMEAEKEKLAAKAKQAWLKKFKVRLDKWRKGEINTYLLDNHRQYTQEDYLRVNIDIIETSQNITLTLDEAKATYQRIMKIIAKGGCQGDCGKILHYSVQEITAKHLKVGCHTIPLKEIKRLAKQLGW